MDCKHKKDGGCEVSRTLGGVFTPLDEGVCKACLKAPKPMAVNHVTCARASYALRVNNLEIPEILVDCATDSIVEPVGTNLRKSIRWFVWKKAARECSKCKNREQVMNFWGSDKCLEEMPQILAWLKESAAEYRLPYNESLVKLVVLKAIEDARN